MFFGRINGGGKISAVGMKSSSASAGEVAIHIDDWLAANDRDESTTDVLLKMSASEARDFWIGLKHALQDAGEVV